MAKAKKPSTPAEHRKRFPFPQIGDSTLTYKEVSIPLEGGHRSLFGFFSSRMTMTEDGWMSKPSGFTQILEMRDAARYKNEAATREAIAKLNRKLKRFESVGLRMHIGGDYRRVFHLKLSYKK